MRHYRIFICAPYNEFTKNFGAALKEKTNAEIVGWVGAKAHVTNELECETYDSWESFFLPEPALIDREAPSPLDITTTDELFTFLKILDRVDFAGYFSFSERFHIFNRQVQLWYSRLRAAAPDAVFFSNTPHLPYDFPIYIAAKHQDIDINIMNVTPFPAVHYFTKTIWGRPAKLPHYLQISEKSLDRSMVIDPFLGGSTTQPWYMERQKAKDFAYQTGKLLRKSRRAVRFVAKYRTGKNKKFVSIKDYEGTYRRKRKSASHSIIKRIHWYNRLKSMASERKKFEQKPDLRHPFIYFPLHYQPEATTAPMAGRYADQLHAIDELSKRIPEGVFLVVKEHPSQFNMNMWGVSGRHTGYWETIAEHENVILAPLDHNSKDLISKSVCVATLTGTAGWEAILQNKRVIVLGAAWYRDHPNAYEMNYFNFSKINDWLKDPDVADTVNPIKYLKNQEIYIECDVHGLHIDQKPRCPHTLAEAVLAVSAPK